MLSLAAPACGNGHVLQGDVDHKTVSGEAGRAGFTILRNDPDVLNDRPSILVKDSDFQGFFTPEDEHAIITAEIENRILLWDWANVMPVL